MTWRINSAIYSFCMAISELSSPMQWLTDPVVTELANAFGHTSAQQGNSLGLSVMTMYQAIVLAPFFRRENPIKPSNTGAAKNIAAGTGTAATDPL